MITQSQFIALTALLVGCSSVQASNVSYYKNALNNHPITKAVRQYGGDLHVINCKDNNVYGFEKQRHIIVCANNIDSLKLAEETLSHEAIHMAQDCHDSKEGSIYYHSEQRADAIKDGFDVSYADEMTEQYKHDKVQHDSEWEAYYFEDSPKTVEKIIHDACTVDLSEF